MNSNIDVKSGQAVQKQKKHSAGVSSNRNTVNEGSSNNASILNLNTDCLDNICRKLALKDQINFASACQRFEQIFVMSSKSKYKKFEINELFSNLTLGEIKIFLQLVGTNIEVLWGNHYYEHKGFEIVAKLLTSHCKNCCTIQLRRAKYEKVNYTNLFKFIGEMTSLVELNLDNTECTDDSLAQITHLPLLKILKLTNNYNLTGSHINKMNFLEVLSLNGCKYIEPDNFENICRNLKNLRHLDIEDCMYIESEDFNESVGNLLHLESLILNIDMEHYDWIGQLPKIKTFGMYNRDWQIDEPLNLLKNFTKYQVNQLEVLKLYTFNMSLESTSLLGQLIRLKVLHLRINNPFDDLCLHKLSQLTELQEIDIYCEGVVIDNGLLHLLEHCFKLKDVILRSVGVITMGFVQNALKLLKEQRIRMQRTTVVSLHMYGRQSIFQLITDSDRDEWSDLLNILPKTDYDDNNSYDDDDDYSYYGDDNFSYHYDSSNDSENFCYDNER